MRTPTRQWRSALPSVLEKSGYVVWWDALIEGGTRYAGRSTRRFRQGRRDRRPVVEAIDRIPTGCRDEAAQGRDRRRLVPFSLDGTLPPLGFRQLQMIDLSDWHGRSGPQLKAIERAIATAAGQQPLEDIAGSRPRLTRRQAIVGGGGAAAVAVAGGSALLAWDRGWLGTPQANRSIAVLPFKDLSVGGKQAYLSDGLTEEIRSALSRNAGLLVLAETSSSAARDMTGDAKAIAGRLGVAYLLEGSVEREGDMVRVGTNLTNGHTGFSEWSQRVERKLDDIFAFESESRAPSPMRCRCEWRPTLRHRAEPATSGL